MRDAGEIDRSIAAFARAPNGGLVVAGSAGSQIHRRHIITQAARHRLPAVYTESTFTAAGGLAAGYVDRILKGEKPSNLPVQAPTKYELSINLKIAKALGLTVPPSVLARADEVIE